MNMDTESEYRESSSEHETTSSAHSSPSVSPKRQGPLFHKKRRRESFNELSEAPSPKRIKGDFNAAYVILLNEDIQDASLGLIHGEENSALGYTQIGEVIWSIREKNAFFAAVSCLGKHDVANISARIGTKSESEVQQYLVLLDAPQQRRSGDGGRKTPLAIVPADIPAAVEIGDECVAALEAAADGVATRQQAYEEEREKRRWGSRWLITLPLSQLLEDSFTLQQERLRSTRWPRKPKPPLGDEDGQTEQPRSRNREKDDVALSFLELFSIQNWLRLSKHVFMNSAVADSNWHSLSEDHEEPAIRATAFADFRRLALSITKRLVLATIYVTESRTRAKRVDDPQKRRKRRVKVEDVAAAVSSLGMVRNRKEFWARCARRLQLNVVDDSVGEGDLTDRGDGDIGIEGRDIDPEDCVSTVASSPESEADNIEGSAKANVVGSHKVISYDEVEILLGYRAVNRIPSRAESQDSASSSSGDSASSADEYESDDEDSQTDLADESEKQNTKADTGRVKQESDESLNQIAIAQDIEEALVYLVPIKNIREKASTRRAIESRIWAEHRLERDAEQLDLQASEKAEADLWAMLRDNSN
ncbi:hypothetical protein GGS21DRAFT_101808 [Xylaria nigripes]|nr:hypothetical protein GGS21DRAFT_101808 [Xylaria nigripes]